MFRIYRAHGQEDAVATVHYYDEGSRIDLPRGGRKHFDFGEYGGRLVGEVAC